MVLGLLDLAVLLTTDTTGGRMNRDIERRTFLQGAGLAALAAAAVEPGQARAQRAVPNSAGSAAPRVKAPANTCDCHMHIYDERFPVGRPGSRLQTNASVKDYRLLQQRLGTSRVVIVTPAVYVTDNRVTLDAIAQLGPAARGVGVVTADGAPTGRTRPRRTSRTTPRCSTSSPRGRRTKPRAGACWWTIRKASTDLRGGREGAAPVFRKRSCSNNKKRENQYRATTGSPQPNL